MPVEADLPSHNETDARANRFDVVSRLADDLAHEIKNPLNSIVINLEVLKVRAARGDDAGAIERAGVIEQETRRLHIMVDRLLQLLRPDRDDASGFALDRVIEELAPLIEARTRLARNAFAIEGDAAVIIPVRRDTFKFAVLNVLTAVHDRLGEGGGSLVLRCRTAEGRALIDVFVRRDPEAGPGGSRDLADSASARGSGDWSDSIATARALLREFGATLSETADGVTLDLPVGSDG